MKKIISPIHSDLIQRFWIEFLLALESLVLQETILLGLSGGNSLDIFYSYIWEHFREIPAFLREKVRFCLLDERIVPVNHPDSNEGQLRQKFLMKLIEEGSINESQILGISSYLSLAIPATKVQESIPWENVGIQNSGTLDSVINMEWQERQQSLVNTYSQIVPRIDIALFGVGWDGHIASLFPHHPLLCSLEQGYLEITDSPKLPAHRITVSPMMVRSIPYVFVAFMRGKEEVLAAFKNRSILWEACPVKIFLQSENLVMMSDIDE